MELTTRLKPVPRMAPVLAVIGVLLLAVAIAIVAIGSQHRLPPPFGFAGNGTFAWVSNGQIMTSDLGTMTPRQITQGAPTFDRPAYSRDGTKIAYERFADSRRTAGDVLVADADGSNPIVVDHAVAPIGIISWSPDGRSLAYMVWEKPPEGGRLQVAVAAADGSTRTIIDTLPGDAWGPTWSPDGTRLAAGVDPGGYTDIYVVDRDGKNPQKLNHIRSKEGGDTDVDWTPDGSTIAFAAGFPNDAIPGQLGIMAVYLVGFDGATERLVSEGVATATNPTFSPDGSQLAYMSSDDSGKGWHVVIADAAGHTIKTLPGYHGNRAPIWSPDGSKIAVEDWIGPEETGTARLVVLDVAGKDPVIELPAGQLNMLRPEYAVAWQRVAQ
jgi:Tol biopolymer transport system component